MDRKLAGLISTLWLIWLGLILAILGTIIQISPATPQINTSQFGAHHERLR